MSIENKDSIFREYYFPVFKPGVDFIRLNLQDLLGDYIEDADLGNIIVPLYDPNSTESSKYELGSYCIHEKKLYRCNKELGTYGRFDPEAWDRINLLDLVNDCIEHSESLSRDVYERDLESIISSFYTPTQAYSVGDIVIKVTTDPQTGLSTKELYSCKEAVEADTEWDSSKWSSFKLTDTFSPTTPGLVPATGTPTGERFLSDTGTWTHIPNGILVDTDLGNLVIGYYDESHAYVAGDYCIYQKRLYKAKTSTTGNLPTDATYWECKLIINVITETVNEAISGLGTVLTYKDSKTVAQLNSDDTLRHKGYVYSITGADGTLDNHGSDWDGNVTAGDEVVWVGTRTNGNWIYLGNVTNIEECIKKADLAALIGSIYNSNNTYNINDIVYNSDNKRLYKCTENNVTGAWDISKWAELTIDVFKGATANAGSAPGLVPKATPTDRTKVLTGDGQWTEVEVYNTDTIDAMDWSK